MLIADYLEKPDRSIASPDEEAAIQRILFQCGSANTALLRLYRVAKISEQEIEGIEDEIERLGKLHEDECAQLRGEPVEPPGPDPMLLPEGR